MVKQPVVLLQVLSMWVSLRMFVLLISWAAAAPLERARGSVKIRRWCTPFGSHWRLERD